MLLSGSHDPITPPSYALLALESLPESKNYVIDGFGHGASLHSACGRQLVVDHISDPDANLDTRCIDDHIIPFGGSTTPGAESSLNFDALSFNFFSTKQIMN